MQLNELIEKFVRQAGMVSAWLNPLLVVLICADVLLRYLFNQSANWILEMEWHLFGMIFLLGSAYTLQEDKHVRVDVLYHRLSLRWQSVIDIICTLVLLIPWCIVGIITCYNYASNSYYILEGSPNPGGLPWWFVIKFLMVVCFVLLLLQSLVMIVKKIKNLTS